ncbi:hypothetical protein HNY73_017477 [Argiope bruennichi]|uniref:Uncharacterized protein n=1 Tax=Argiope bruennichi TaxID=94029 RepID=A0A8T0EB13_ARGBR|nr:hypothetical protein HNY73_017477 [Argiope bruennichi]
MPQHTASEASIKRKLEFGAFGVNYVRKNNLCNLVAGMEPMDWEDVCTEEPMDWEAVDSDEPMDWEEIPLPPQVSLPGRSFSPPTVVRPVVAKVTTPTPKEPINARTKKAVRRM